jgi:predicted pyridoxine 5'-phosphate oxidase superfamily flavin-nucleotide-binding protein
VHSGEHDDLGPFHRGEQAVQERLGVREKIAAVGRRVIRDFMPDQHRDFFRHLPFLVVGAVDSSDQPWASVLTNPPGFITSPDPRHLVIEARFHAGDPLERAVVTGARLGLLGIEPHTRRRNRMNGIVVQRTDGQIDIEVQQSFGNCSKYIQARRPQYFDDHRVGAVVDGGSRLDSRARAVVESADTFFIATAHPPAAPETGKAFGLDVSHRGGKPGFVRVDGDTQLTVPDFVGNFLFNTLGNITINPKAGLLFIDFATGDLLYLAVHATIVWEGPEVATFAGAQRLLRCRLTHALRLEHALPLRWGAVQPSPFLDTTGRWR